MHLRSILVSAAGAAAALAIAAGPASAGEAQGNSGPGDIRETGMRGHAHSVCGFSGQNPERFLDPSDPNYEPGRVQNWGHVKQDLRAQGAPAELIASIRPGISCNPNRGGEEPTP